MQCRGSDYNLSVNKSDTEELLECSSCGIDYWEFLELEQEHIVKEEVRPKESLSEKKNIKKIQSEGVRRLGSPNSFKR
jgi:hypothetical protein